MQSKQEKRNKADAMHAEWRKLTIPQQIKELKKRPGNCAKQLARLTAKLAP